MKKKRGLRRYFKNLNKKEMNIPELWIKDGFVSYDKLWVDYLGYNGIRKREPHIECLIRNFDRIKDQVSILNSSFQIWICLNETNGYEDCIIVNTPNSINPFPHKFVNYSHVNLFKNKELVNFINLINEFDKIYGTYFVDDDERGELEEKFCVLYKNGIGESII
jgi:hypothetical protein